MNNIQYAFCLSTDLPSRKFRKSDSEACKVFEGVAESYFKIFRTAKYWEAGRAYAFFGDCLENGNTGEKNLKDAIEWYNRGTLAGNEYSAFRYAEHLENGVGTLRDPKGALAAYNKSASLGFNLAQNRLGVIYAEGELVPRNLIEAYKWFLIATSNGYEPAKKNRQHAETKLTHAEIRTAELAAKKWLDQNSKP